MTNKHLFGFLNCGGRVINCTVLFWRDVAQKWHRIRSKRYFLKIDSCIYILFWNSMPLRKFAKAKKNRYLSSGEHMSYCAFGIWIMSSEQHLCENCKYLGHYRYFDILKKNNLPKPLLSLRDQADKTFNVLDRCHTKILACIDCSTVYEVEEEWYEFNDTGLAFTHTITIKRQEIPKQDW